MSVYVVLSLKAVSPIDCHYMTDRLQRIELKIFVNEEETMSPTSCMPGGKQINITLTCYGGTIPFKFYMFVGRAYTMVRNHREQKASLKEYFKWFHIICYCYFLGGGGIFGGIIIIQ